MSKGCKNCETLQTKVDLALELVRIFEKVEENSEGREFHPNTINSCRVGDTVRIGQIITGLKKEDKIDTGLRCRRCDSRMVEGVALKQNFSAGMGDFIGDKVGMTFSPDGTADMVDCWKCHCCGHSITKGDNDE